MVETITPVVHGGRARWLGTLALHGLGAATTAALFGATLGWIGGTLGAPWRRSGLLAVAAVAAVYAFGELSPLRVPVPQLRRQVPDWWRTFFGRRTAAALYGLGLGVGFLTYLAHGTLVAVAFTAASSGRPEIGALLVMPFGLVRGLSPVVGRRLATPEQRRAMVDRLASSPVSRLRAVNGAALLVLAATALVASAGVPSGGWAALASATLASAFAWAALSKLFGYRRWRRALGAHRLPGWADRVLAWVVPLVEIAVPALVVLGSSGAAAVVSGVVLSVFSLELVRIHRRSGDRLPCGCFGGRETVGLRAALLRNAALGALAVSVVVGATRGRPLGWPTFSPSDVLPLLLSVGSIVVAGLATWRASIWLARGART